MYIDNLTVAGIAIASVYLLMPVLLRREMLAIAPDAPASSTPDQDAAVILKPCPET